jgi:hypothetical protein
VLGLISEGDGLAAKALGQLGVWPLKMARPAITGVCDVDARVVGEGEDRRVTVFFSHQGFPGIRFGHRFPAPLRSSFQPLVMGWGCVVEGERGVRSPSPQDARPDGRRSRRHRLDDLRTC